MKKRYLLILLISLTLLIHLILISVLVIKIIEFKKEEFPAEKYDKEFRTYLKDNYNLQLNDKKKVAPCYSNCDAYGYYTVGNDYNYVVQISKTGETFKVSYDEDAVNKRKALYQFIQETRGKDIAPNYLGFYKNTSSGTIAYSSSETGSLYYIVKYNNNMKLNEELKKDYEILKKAQEIIGKHNITSMKVLYVKDTRLEDEEWVLKLNIDVGDTEEIVLYPEKYFNKYKYFYQISSYNKEEFKPLASLSYNDFEYLVFKEIKEN